MTPKTKVCKYCVPPQAKPLTAEFFSRRSRSDDGFADKCKACESRDHQEYYLRKKKDKHRQQVHRKSNLKRLYDLTVEEYNEMFERQGGACAICMRTGIKLVVDHDHATGLPRGLLCPACNHGLGRFYDNVAILVSAQRYLEVHNARQYNKFTGGEREGVRPSSLSDGLGAGSVAETSERLDS